MLAEGPASRVVYRGGAALLLCKLLKNRFLFMAEIARDSANACL